MRKAKRDDVIDLLDSFCERYDLSRSDIHYPIFKGILELPAFAGRSSPFFLKTNQENLPTIVALDNGDDRKPLLMDINYQKWFPVSFSQELSLVYPPIKTTSILKKDDKSLLLSVNELLEKSETFKELIDNLHKNITKEQMQELNTTHNTPLFKIMVDVYNADKETDLYKLNNLKDSISLAYRKFEHENYLGMVVTVATPENCDFNTFKTIFSERVSRNFELFKYHHEIILGLASVAETEFTLSNQSIVNDFFDTLYQEYPEYFLSRKDGLHQYTLDDKYLIDQKINFQNYSKDFDLLSTEGFNIINLDFKRGLDDYPHLKEGNEGLNSVRFVGENVFYKEYYVYLEHIQTLNDLNVYVIEAFEFDKTLPLSIYQDVIDQCLQFASQSKCVLDIKRYVKDIGIGNNEYFNVVDYFNDNANKYPNVTIINSQDSNREIAKNSKDLLSNLKNCSNQSNETRNDIKFKM